MNTPEVLMLSDLPTAAAVYLVALFALLGLVLGSALNCLALRLSSGRKWSGRERSACPHCAHTLSPLELIPLLSFLLQRGRCRHCGAPISPRYPLTEAALSLCFVALLAKFGLTWDILTPLVFTCCLFCLSLVDLDTQIIPDRFLLIPLLARVAEVLLRRGPSGLTALLPGFAIASAVLLLSLLMDKLLKKDTMGGGDIKLLFLIGCYLSFPQCLLMLMLACLLGIVMASILMKLDSETPFPFGPALSLAAFLTLLVGDRLVSWYLGLF